MAVLRRRPTSHARSGSMPGWSVDRTSAWWARSCRWAGSTQRAWSLSRA